MSPVTRHPSLLTFLAVLLLFSCTNTEQQYKTIDGFALGTTYHIIYRDVEGRNFQPVVDCILADLCASLSIYYYNSII